MSTPVRILAGLTLAIALADLAWRAVLLLPSGHFEAVSSALDHLAGLRVALDGAVVCTSAWLARQASGRARVGLAVAAACGGLAFLVAMGGRLAVDVAWSGVLYAVGMGANVGTLLALAAGLVALAGPSGRGGAGPSPVSRWLGIAVAGAALLHAVTSVVRRVDRALDLGELPYLLTLVEDVGMFALVVAVLHGAMPRGGVRSKVTTSPVAADPLPEGWHAVAESLRFVRGAVLARVVLGVAGLGFVASARIGGGDASGVVLFVALGAGAVSLVVVGGLTVVLGSPATSAHGPARLACAALVVGLGLEAWGTSLLLDVLGAAKATSFYSPSLSRALDAADTWPFVAFASGALGVAGGGLLLAAVAGVADDSGQSATAERLRATMFVTVGVGALAVLTQSMARLLGAAALLFAIPLLVAAIWALVRVVTGLGAIAAGIEARTRA